MTPSTTLSAETVSFVCTTVRSRSAIELDASKSYLIEARLSPVARATGFGSIDDFIKGVRMKTKPELESRMVKRSRPTRRASSGTFIRLKRCASKSCPSFCSAMLRHGG